MSEFIERNKQNIKYLGIIVVVLLILGYITYSFTTPGGRFADVQNDLKSIKPADEQPYTDLDGRIVDLKEFGGKPLIVNAWATWIPFSQTEIPMLARLSEKYGDRITILAINRMETGAVVKGYLSTFNIAERSVNILIDPSDNFYKAVEGYAMPETVIYNAEGVKVDHIRGVVTEEILTTHIESMLNE